MREEAGDLFTYPADAIVIPINWTTKKNGNAVMGAGVANQAAKRWPKLPRWLGMIIAESEPHVHAVQLGGLPPWIVAFPTKVAWRSPSDLGLIEAMARQMSNMGRDWDPVAPPVSAAAWAVSSGTTCELSWPLSLMTDSLW